MIIVLIALAVYAAIWSVYTYHKTHSLPDVGRTVVACALGGVVGVGIALLLVAVL